MLVKILLILMVHFLGLDCFAAAACEPAPSKITERRCDDSEDSVKTRIYQAVQQAGSKTLAFFDTFFVSHEELSVDQIKDFFVACCAKHKDLWDTLLESLTESQEDVFKDTVDAIKTRYLVQPGRLNKPQSKEVIRKSLEVYYTKLLEAFNS